MDINKDLEFFPIIRDRPRFITKFQNDWLAHIYIVVRIRLANSYPIGGGVVFVCIVYMYIFTI